MEMLLSFLSCSFDASLPSMKSTATSTTVNTDSPRKSPRKPPKSATKLLPVYR